MLQNLALQNGLQNLASLKGLMINMYHKDDCAAGITDLNAPAGSSANS